MANTFKSAVSKNVGTAAVAILDVATDKSAVLIGCTVANTTNQQIAVNVVLRRASVDYYLIMGALVPVGSAFVWTGGELKTVCQAIDEIRVSSSNDSSCDVILSYLEIA